MGAKDMGKAAAVTGYVLTSSLLGEPQPTPLSEALFELNQTRESMEVRDVDQRPEYGDHGNK